MSAPVKMDNLHSLDDDEKLVVEIGCNACNLYYEPEIRFEGNE
jgi:hypothetical protein